MYFDLSPRQTLDAPRPAFDAVLLRWSLTRFLIRAHLNLWFAQDVSAIAQLRLHVYKSNFVSMSWAFVFAAGILRPKSCCTAGLLQGELRGEGL